MNDAEARIAALESQVAALLARFDAPDVGAPDLDAPPAAVPGTGNRRLSRRRLFAAAFAGGAGLVATQITTGTPAIAAPGNNLVLGASNDGGSAITTVTATTGLNSSPFAVVNPDPHSNSIGMNGRLGQQTGFFDGSGYQRAAVVGESALGTGVTGMSGTSAGVYGWSQSGSGVVAQCTGDHPGVRASSVGGHGVYAETGGASDTAALFGASENGVGVNGLSNKAPGVSARSLTNYGVFSSCGGTKAAVYGYSEAGPGVEAVGNGTAPGVSATSTSGPGLSAVGGGTSPAVDAASTRGYGIQARGARAPLRLVPSTHVGAPTTGSHQLGELVVDKLGALYLCTVAGAPGTWKKVVVA